MTAFRTRRFEAGDELELNAVFNQITRGDSKRPLRPLDHMRWLWHRAPGGPTDSWVVEAEDNDGWKIIGHHALTPVRFTYGDEDWLCGKTMNTFLLPEFRDKFLYLRFEQGCLREADARFDATYSIAPGTSRLRTAFGYENMGNWILLERGFQPFNRICRALADLTGRCSYRARVGLLRASASISAAPKRRPSLEFVEHSAAEAASSRFFADFWTEARREAGMAPRRDAADLEWRFWKHPGFEGSTLTYEWPEGGRAYFILDNTAGDSAVYSLVDFFITPADPRRLDCILDALFVWCARRGALALDFFTTTRGLPPQLLEVFLRKMKPSVMRRVGPEKELPRRVTPLGRARGNGAIADWNATGILMVN
jgi:hypothetical protein